MNEWTWFSRPVQAEYYFDKVDGETAVHRTFYLGFRYCQENETLVYLTEGGFQINRSDVLRHKCMVTE